MPKYRIELSIIEDLEAESLKKAREKFLEMLDDGELDQKLYAHTRGFEYHESMDCKWCSEAEACPKHAIKD